VIGRLTGILREKKPPQLLVEVHGVGYELEAPMSTFYELAEPGATVMLYTHFVIRQDAQLLYGFHSEQARQIFREIIKVNGVGPKMGLAILSGMDAEGFRYCIEHADLIRLAKLPGIGKKTAERLVIELRDKLCTGHTATRLSYTHDITLTSPQDDAIGALVALGYKPAEATKLVRQVYIEGMTSEELIRSALRSAL